MRPICQMSLAAGMLSIVAGGLAAEAEASPARLWVGSASACCWEDAAIPTEALEALAEGGFGVALEFEKRTGNGRGSDHERTIPVASLESFFSHNDLIAVLVQPVAYSAASEASASQLSGGYSADEALWRGLSTPESLARFSQVLETFAVLMAGADPSLVDGLEPFAMATGDSGEVHKEIFFLADGEPNSGSRSPFTVEVIGDGDFSQDRLFSQDTYTFLDPASFGDSLTASTPILGVRTPERVYEVWVHPVVLEEEEWLAARAALEEAVGLSSTRALAPARGLRDRTEPPP